MQGKPTIYRQEALEHHNSVQEEGDVLHISPEWTRWTYWLILGLVGTALLLSVLGTVSEYASGPAVVHFEGKVEVTSHGAGLVAAVEVHPGQQVRAGQRLVTFASQEETASLERLRLEHELQLVRYLREPADAAVRQTLSAARAELELANARLETRSLRAPCDGLVSDVRVRSGQYLNPGMGVLSVIPEGSQPVLVALLPGDRRPQLRPGMMLRLELESFHHEYQDVPIDYVGDQIIGPGEAMRYLGTELEGAFELKGSIVLVRARLPSRTFVSAGDTYNYFDGMPARVEARVRTESILLTLVPGLKELLRYDR